MRVAWLPLLLEACIFLIGVMHAWAFSTSLHLSRQLDMHVLTPSVKKSHFPLKKLETFNFDQIYLRKY